MLKRLSSILWPIFAVTALSSSLNAIMDKGGNESVKSLIINADDFGFSRGVNLGIIEAFQHGVLTSTTLMVNMQEADHAVELARQNPELGVGIHLTLTAGRPILGGLHTITDEEGNFRKLLYRFHFPLCP